MCQVPPADTTALYAGMIFQAVRHRQSLLANNILDHALAVTERNQIRAALGNLVQSAETGDDAARLACFMATHALLEPATITTLALDGTQAPAVLAALVGHGELVLGDELAPGVTVGHHLLKTGNDACARLFPGNLTPVQLLQQMIIPVLGEAETELLMTVVRASGYAEGYLDRITPRVLAAAITLSSERHVGLFLNKSNDIDLLSDFLTNSNHPLNPHHVLNFLAGHSRARVGAGRRAIQLVITAAESDSEQMMDVIARQVVFTPELVGQVVAELFHRPRRLRAVHRLMLQPGIPRAVGIARLLDLPNPFTFDRFPRYLQALHDAENGAINRATLCELGARLLDDSRQTAAYCGELSRSDVTRLYDSISDSPFGAQATLNISPRTANGRHQVLLTIDQQAAPEFSVALDTALADWRGVLKKA